MIKYISNSIQPNVGSVSGLPTFRCAFLGCYSNAFMHQKSIAFTYSNSACSEELNAKQD